MPSSLNHMESLLNNHFEEKQFTVLRIPHVLDAFEVQSVSKRFWHEIIPISEDTKTAVITMGPSVKAFKNKIESNDLNIALIDAETINRVDSEIVNKLIEKKIRVLVYNLEGEFDLLTYTLQQYLSDNSLNLDYISMNLNNVALNDSSKSIKTINKLHIEDALSLLERK